MFSTGAPLASKEISQDETSPIELLIPILVINTKNVIERFVPTSNLSFSSPLAAYSPSPPAEEVSLTFIEFSRISLRFDPPDVV